jgi:hypothetical protein
MKKTGDPAFIVSEDEIEQDDDRNGYADQPQQDTLH